MIDGSKIITWTITLIFIPVILTGLLILTIMIKIQDRFKRK